MIIPNTGNDTVKKSESELVEQERHEHKLIGSYLYTKGLTLFSYNHKTDEICRVALMYGDTIYVKYYQGALVTYDPETEKAIIDTRLDYFETLNVKSARSRVNRHRSGHISELCNLREYDPNSILQINPFN